MFIMGVNDVVQQHLDEISLQSSSADRQLEGAKPHKGGGHPAHHCPGLKLHIAIVEHVPVHAVTGAYTAQGAGGWDLQRRKQRQQQQQWLLHAAAAVSPSLLYISGSEEKVLRVFEAPQAFTDTLTAVRNSQSAEASAAVAAALADAAAAEAARAQAAEGRGSSSSTASRGHARALGASVAALGLSNKAVYVDDTGGTEDDKGSKDAAKGSGFGPEAYMEGPDFVPCAAPSVVHDPPYEEHLAQNTLWPEIRKLYGHGNDVFCVCSSPSGRLIASACKAQSAGAAAVWVWEVGSWKPISQLSGHTLTVTQLEFSHDGRYLLSGSRDRSFSLWRVPEELQWRHPDTAAAAASSPAEPGGELSVTAAAAAAAAADIPCHGGGHVQCADHSPRAGVCVQPAGRSADVAAGAAAVPKAHR